MKECSMEEWENLVMNGVWPEGWDYSDIEELDDTITKAIEELYNEPTINERENNGRD